MGWVGHREDWVTPKRGNSRSPTEAPLLCCSWPCSGGSIHVHAAFPSGAFSFCLHRLSTTEGAASPRSLCGSNTPQSFLFTTEVEQFNSSTKLVHSFKTIRHLHGCRRADGVPFWQTVVMSGLHYVFNFWINCQVWNVKSFHIKKSGALSLPR